MAATLKSARTVFSPSPIHFDVSEDMEKKVALHSCAIAADKRLACSEGQREGD